MRGFQISKVDNGWRFELIPCNNNSNPIGVSCVYPSYSECRKAFVDFKSFIIDNCIADANSHFINIIKEDCNKFYYEYRDLSGQKIFGSIYCYATRSSCKSAIRRIYTHLNEYMLTEKSVGK